MVTSKLKGICKASLDYVEVSMIGNDSTNLKKYVKKISPKYYWLFSGIIAALLMLFIFSVSDLLANGQHIIARLDMSHQYIPFIQYLKRVIFGEHSYLFSWSNCWGQDTASVWPYYTFSPFNIVFYILPKEYEMTAAVINIVLKTAVSAAVMQLFLAYFFKSGRYSTVIFSLCYALCAYQINYYFAMNFTDGIYIYPCIMLGIVILIREGKIRLLLFSYIYMMLNSFYIGYMMGICSFVMFILYLVFFRKKILIASIKRILCKYILCAVIAITSTAVVWLPTLMQILLYGEEDFGKEKVINSNPIWIFNNLFSSQLQTLDGYVPYVYCSVLAFILLMLFFFNKKIELSNKYYAISVMVVLVLVMWIRPLNYFMHGMDTTQMIGYRYSFVFSFIVCVIACKQIRYVKSITGKSIIGLGIGFSLLFSFSYILYHFFYDEGNSNDLYSLIINAVIIMLYVLVWYIAKKKKCDISTMAILLTFIVGIDLCISSVVCIRKMYPPTFLRETYFEGKQIEDNTFENIPICNNGEFYRIQDICERQRNMGFERDYYSISGYSSLISKNSIEFASDMGMGCGTHEITAHGLTDAMKALLSVRYSVNLDVEKNGDNTWVIGANDKAVANYLHINTGLGKSPVKENKKYLSLGFMTHSDVTDIDFTDSPFDNQDILLSCLTGQEVNTFEMVKPQISLNAAMIGSKNELESMGITLPKKCGSISGENIIIKCDNSKVSSLIEDKGCKYAFDHEDSEYENRVVFKVAKCSEPVACYFGHSALSSGRAIIVSDYIDDIYEYYALTGKMKTAGIKWLDMNSDNIHTVMLFLDKDSEYDSFGEYYFSKYNESEWDRAYDILTKSQLELSKIEDGYVKGSIEAIDNGIMFTSIPYSEGWTAKVDGKECEVLPIINEAFVGIDLTSGVHEIELKYVTPGLYLGIAITCLGVIMLLCVGIVNIKKAKSRMGFI